MSFPVTVLQTLSAFVIFVAGYLMLFASIIGTVVLASCVYEGSRFIRAYTVRTGRVIEADSPGKGGYSAVSLEK